MKNDQNKISFSMTTVFQNQMSTYSLSQNVFKKKSTNNDEQDEDICMMKHGRASGTQFCQSIAISRMLPNSFYIFCKQKLVIRRLLMLILQIDMDHNHLMNEYNHL